MIGLSVAVGRFVEALFWAILKTAGTVATVVFAAALVLLVALLLLRRAWRKRQSSPRSGEGDRSAEPSGGGGLRPGQTSETDPTADHRASAED